MSDQRKKGRLRIGQVEVVIGKPVTPAKLFQDFAERHRTQLEILRRITVKSRLNEAHLRAYEDYTKRGGNKLSKEEFLAVMREPTDCDEVLERAYMICLSVCSALGIGLPDDADVVLTAKILGALGDTKFSDAGSLWAESRVIQGTML